MPLQFYKLSLWRAVVEVHGDKAPNVAGYFRQCNIKTIFLEALIFPPGCSDERYSTFISITFSFSPSVTTG